MHLLHQAVFVTLAVTIALTAFGVSNEPWLRDDNVIQKTRVEAACNDTHHLSQFTGEDVHLVGGLAYICFEDADTKIAGTDARMSICVETISFFEMIGYPDIGRALVATTYALSGTALLCAFVALSHTKDKWRAVWALVAFFFLLIVGIAWIVGASYVNNDLFNDKTIELLLSAFHETLVLDAKPTILPITVTALGGGGIILCAAVIYFFRDIKKRTADESMLLEDL